MIKETKFSSAPMPTTELAFSNRAAGACSLTNQTLWQDLGARIVWQDTGDIDKFAESLSDNAHLVVVSSRFTATNTAQRTLSNLDLPSPQNALPSEHLTFFQTLFGVEPLLWKRFGTSPFLPFPTGSRKTQSCASPDACSISTDPIRPKSSSICSFVSTETKPIQAL